MKAMAAKQPSQDFHRQHQEVIQAPLIQNEIPSTDAIVLQRMSACPCDGGCPLCEGDMVIQPKLRIGNPGDRYEREADRMRANSHDHEFHSNTQIAGTRCVSMGPIPFLTWNADYTCARPCTSLHELTHNYDLLMCCLKYRQAMSVARETRNLPLMEYYAILYTNYALMMKPWIEHRAYSVQLYCLNLLKSNLQCPLPSEIATTILIILGTLAGATIGALTLGPITATGGAITLSPAGPPGMVGGFVIGELMAILGGAFTGALVGLLVATAREYCCQEVETQIRSTISNLRRYPAGATQHRCPFP